MQDLFWGNKSWAFSNQDNMANNDENPGKLLLEAANFHNPPPPQSQTAEPTRRPPLAANNNAGRKRKRINVEGNEQDGNEVGGAVGRGKVWHLTTERERRNKMRSMFDDLHALLPQLPPKAYKATVVSEAIKSIKSLEQTLEKLEKEKHKRQLNSSVRYESSKTIPAIRSPLSMVSREAFLADWGTGQTSNQLQTEPAFLQGGPAMFRTWMSPNVVLSVAGNNAHINVCCTKMFGVLTGLCGLIEKHNLELVSLQLSSAQHQTMFMIHARANVVALENTSHEQLSRERIFQQAAWDVMNYVTSLRS